MMEWVGGDVHPWVAARRERVTLGLQAFARPDDPLPGERVIAAGRLADALGLDAFYLGDHPAHATEAWLHLAVLAATTERVRLGSVVNCVLYRHPIMTARLAADLDHLSGGRTLLGLGIGWDVPEFGELGMTYPPTPQRHAALEEALAIIAGVWGDEPFSYIGRHYTVTNARIAPAPTEQPHPPLLIAGAGERMTLRQVARFADACNFGPSPQIGGVRTPDDVRRKFEVLRRHCQEVGRPYENILRTHFTPWLMLAPTEAEARSKLDHYYPNGLTDDQRFSRIVGTPEQVAAYYQALVEAGVQHFVCQSLDAADTETFRLLAEEVAPRVAAG
ncbi:MAG: LLM class flavin-dependent oxidoreductase [Vicinamibacterales bacterium]